MFNKAGIKVTAVETFSGAVENKNGLNISLLKSHLRQKKKISEFESGTQISHEAFFSSDVNIFIPAALENQINIDSVKMIKARLIIEAANGATTPDADTILNKNGIDLIPGMLGNSAVLISSYFEWLQNKRSEFWSREECEKKLMIKIEDAYDRINENAVRYSCPMRTAAFITALKRLQIIYNDRGIFP